MCTTNRIEALEKLFKDFDLNGDGFIAADELKVVMQGIDASWTDERVAAVFVAADGKARGRVDIHDFAAWIFADTEEQASFCDAVGFHRGIALGTKTSAALGVPPSMHSRGLQISEDGLMITSTLKTTCQGAFLSSKLSAGNIHTLRVGIEGPTTSLYLGICTYDRQNFDCLPVLSFTSFGSCDNWDNLPATKHYTPSEVARVFAEGGITLCVNMEGGRLSMMDRFGLEVGYWSVEGLNDMEVVFAVSMDTDGMILKLEVASFVVTITDELLESGMMLTCTTMGGDEITTMHIDHTDVKTWGEVYETLREAIPQASGFNLVCVQIDGSLIAESRKSETIESIFRTVT